PDAIAAAGPGLFGLLAERQIADDGGAVFSAAGAGRHRVRAARVARSHSQARPDALHHQDDAEAGRARRRAMGAAPAQGPRSGKMLGEARRRREEQSREMIWVTSPDASLQRAG